MLGIEISNQTIFVILLCLALGEAALFLLVVRGMLIRRGARSGEGQEDVAGTLSKLAAESKDARKDIQTLLRISRATSELAEASISKVALVRFNPFQGMGGDQSFSLALLDAKNNGFVLTSIHANDTTRI